jgi:hypothetical protein
MPLLEVPVKLQVSSTINSHFESDGMSIFPNPVSNDAIISFGLNKSEMVVISIYNVYGQKISTLYSGFAHEGENRILWNTSSIKNAMYIVKVHLSDKELVKICSVISE